MFIENWHSITYGMSVLPFASYLTESDNWTRENDCQQSVKKVFCWTELAVSENVKRFSITK